MMQRLAIVGLVLSSLACAQDGTAQDAAAGGKPTELADRVGYSIGHDLGKRLKQDGVAVNADRLLQGLRDGLSATAPQLSQEEMTTTFNELQQAVAASRETQQKEQSTKNLAEGQAFLEQNKTKNGVVTTASGLQYEVLTMGSGERPKAESTVQVHYRGTLLDGTTFDSSYDRGQPATFPVNRVIAGWTEVLQLMPIGSKWKVYIPSALGYGEAGAGPNIGPNATLVFEVELLGIEG